MTATKIFVLNKAELALAEKLSSLVIGTSGPVSIWLKGRDGDNLKTALRASFDAGNTIIALAASGIVIRCLADLLSNKRAEPPVISVAVDGSSIVPLLGGHHGANNLATSLAVGIGGHAAITTASDLLWGIALDHPPAGWAWANDTADVQAFMMRLNQTRCVHITADIACDWLLSSNLPIAQEASLHIHIGLNPPAQDMNAQALWLVPQCLSIGMGCERHCDADHLLTLLDKTLAQHQLPKAAIGGVFSIDVKTNERGLHGMGVTPKFFDADQLNAQRDKLQTPSEVVFREVGVWGVAEGAALAGAGPKSNLLVPKQKTARATIAVAVTEGMTPIMTNDAKPQGKMTLLGLGPGDPGWRAAATGDIIQNATDLVGYSYYIDQVEPLSAGQTRHDFALGEEEKRCAFALDLAAQGKNVVLLCSGDPGVYAMGAPLFELIDRHADDKAEWGRVDIQVQPGITAMLAAAAKLGAPLGHDFCAISLSDLLTPRDAILQRLNGAAVGDFVTCFYNPVSKRRRELLDVARDTLLQHRPADTPVVICRQVGRAEESFHHVTLETLKTDDVDMWCMVMIGSSQTRYTQADSNGHKWLFTPRGYANKVHEEG